MYVTLKDTVGNFLPEKLRMLITLLGDFFSFPGHYADELPETVAETLSRGIRVYLPVVLPVSFIFLFFCLCRCCCRRRISGGRMMRAPGRPGRHVPRSSFESDPRGYFANLHKRGT
ncbi:hypothetical protein KSP39_PZI012077 [Platanthera zijinensis]|uniref:Uncharacterized protein n=1 Tax=Platanthera zijinensis TaxID=2320716 RepID=A0AAP0G4D8_9ASPA